MPISGIRIALLDFAIPSNFWTISRTHGTSPVLRSLAAISMLIRHNQGYEDVLQIKIMGAVIRASFYNWGGIEVVRSNRI
jgi:hypothetical protein